MTTLRFGSWREHLRLYRPKPSTNRGWIQRAISSFPSFSPWFSWVFLNWWRIQDMPDKDWISHDKDKNPMKAKNSRPVGFYSRNSTESTINHKHNNPQTLPPWLCRLPLIRCGIYGSARSDAPNLFRRVRAGGWWKRIIYIVKITL